jgi:hypothetical protein
MTETHKKIILAFADAANDIEAYLKSDVPLECYAKDIDFKIMNLCKEVCELVDK